MDRVVKTYQLRSPNWDKVTTKNAGVYTQLSTPNELIESVKGYAIRESHWLQLMIWTCKRPVLKGSLLTGSFTVATRDREAFYVLFDS